jgi:hypothetical protein
MRDIHITKEAEQESTGAKRHIVDCNSCQVPEDGIYILESDYIALENVNRQQDEEIKVIKIQLNELLTIMSNIVLSNLGR